MNSAPSIAHPDFATPLDQCLAIIAQQNLVIDALKQTVRNGRRLDMYDPRFSESVNELGYQWMEHYMCRHYANGTCRQTAKTCTRFHKVIGPGFLLRELHKIEYAKNLRASPFFNRILMEAHMGQWQSGQRLNMLFYDMKVLLQ